MKLPTIPAPYVGWALCLGMLCALALAGFAVFEIAWAAGARRHYLSRAAASDRYLDSLKALNQVSVPPGSSVRVFPAPRPDTLKRAGR